MKKLATRSISAGHLASLPTFSTLCMCHLLYLIFRCNFDVMENLEFLWDLNTAWLHQMLLRAAASAPAGAPCSVGCVACRPSAAARKESLASASGSPAPARGLGPPCHGPMARERGGVALNSPARWLESRRCFGLPLLPPRAGRLDGAAGTGREPARAGCAHAHLMRFRAGQGSVQLLSGPGSYEAARTEGRAGGHGPPGGMVVVGVSDSFTVAALPRRW